MPLLVRLTDSKIKLRNDVVSKVSNSVKNGWCIREEIGAAGLAINQQTLGSDLNIEPVHWNLEPLGQFGWAEE